MSNYKRIWIRPGDAEYHLTRRTNDDIEYVRAAPASIEGEAQDDGKMDFEQRARAMVLAESRGIDDETAHELIYLRDRKIALESKLAATTPNSSDVWDEAIQIVMTARGPWSRQAPNESRGLIQMKVDAADVIIALLTAARDLEAKRK